MFGEKLFYRKCFCRVIRRNDENSLKHVNNLTKSQEFNPLILLLNCFNSPPKSGFLIKYPVALLEMHDLYFYLIKQQSVSK